MVYENDAVIVNDIVPQLTLKNKINLIYLLKHSSELIFNQLQLVSLLLCVLGVQLKTLKT